MDVTPKWFVAPQSIVRKVPLSLNIIREKWLLLESGKAMNGKLIENEGPVGTECS